MSIGWDLGARRKRVSGGSLTPAPQRLDTAYGDPVVALNYRVEIEEEEDGRWLAEVVDLPGVMAYGKTADDALAHVQALALRVLADRLEHGEGPPGPVSVTFETSAAA
jgi:predicted RNase H-like HicB family nuclease